MSSDLQRFADVKRMPGDWLRRWGLRDTAGGGMEFTHLDIDGSPARSRHRENVETSHPTKWRGNSGDLMVPYGVWHVPTWRAQGAEMLAIVEGESDTLTLWCHGLAALGIPGATMVRYLKREHIQGFEQIFIHNDGDDAGNMFVVKVANRLRSFGFKGDVKQVRFAPFKDVSEVHISCYEGHGGDAKMMRADFYARYAAIIAAGVPVDLSGSTDARSGGSAVFVDWDATKLEHREWYSAGRPFGALVTSEGIGEVGKTSAETDLLSRYTRGEQMPCGTHNDAGNVVIFATEDAADMWKLRLSAAGVNFKSVHMLMAMPNGNPQPQLPNDVSEIEKIMDAKKARVVFFDSLFSNLAPGFDIYKPNDVRAAIGPLVEMLSRKKFLGIAIRHWRKSLGGAHERGLGSVEFRNLSRAGFCFGVHPDDESIRVMACSKSNYGPRPVSQAFRIASVTVIGDDNTAIEAPKVEWLGPADISAEDLAMHGATSADQRSKLDEAKEAILEALGAVDSLSAGELEKQMIALGIAKETFRAARLALKNSGRIRRHGVRGDTRWALNRDKPVHSSASAPEHDLCDLYAPGSASVTPESHKSYKSSVSKTHDLSGNGTIYSPSTTQSFGAAVADDEGEDL